jgi:hypothetical protein
MPYIYIIKFDYDGSNIINEEVKLYNYDSNIYCKTINFYDVPNLLENDIIYNNISNSNIIIDETKGELILN